MRKALPRQIWSLFNGRERLQLAVLTVALVFRAGVELVGVSAIMPFMSVVADPGVVQRNDWLRAAYNQFQFASTTSFLSALAVAVVVVLALSNTFSALTLWWMVRFSWETHHRIATRLFAGYLAQPYAFFVERNSAASHKTLLAEVQQVVKGVLTPALNIVARSLVVLAIIGLLVVLDPKLALAIVLVLGTAYGALYLLVKAKQTRLGQARVEANQERFKVTGEAFGGIKDVKVLEREGAFAAQFEPASQLFSRAIASNAAISVLPRYLLETIAFGGIVMIVLYYLQAGVGLARILPTLSLYAFAGYRLMPELQQLFSGAAALRFNRAALDELTSDLERVVVQAPKRPAGEAIRFERAIEVRDLSFSYPGADRPALDGLSLTIPRNTTVGLVGASGSGKTTLVDLLLGLYDADRGAILIDDRPLGPTTLSAWRAEVGYVPQHIFLCDDTITSNIAFGVPPGEVDQGRVERAARIAHLHDFVTSLPAGYRTVVGERGVRLSGGQRQRIGIARALYHDPEVLIMDEATSALDGATESAVMEAIRELSGRKTIVLIAHRLTTVRDCDCVFVLDQGRLVDQGDFDELSERSESFRTIANLTSMAEAGQGHIS